MYVSVTGAIVIVTSGKVASEVEAYRNRVCVEDLHARIFVDVLVGQHPSAGQSLSLSVGGTVAANYKCITHHCLFGHIRTGHFRNLTRFDQEGLLSR